MLPCFSSPLSEVQTTETSFFSRFRENESHFQLPPFGFEQRKLSFRFTNYRIYKLSYLQIIVFTDYRICRLLYLQIIVFTDYRICRLLYLQIIVFTDYRIYRLLYLQKSVKQCLQKNCFVNLINLHNYKEVFEIVLSAKKQYFLCNSYDI